MADRTRLLVTYERVAIGLNSITVFDVSLRATPNSCMYSIDVNFLVLPFRQFLNQSLHPVVVNEIFLYLTTA